LKKDEIKPGDDVVNFGQGLDDKICGELELKVTKLDNGRYEYNMKVIKAKLTDEKLKEQTYIGKSRENIIDGIRKMKENGHETIWDIDEDN